MTRFEYLEIVGLNFCVLCKHSDFELNPDCDYGVCSDNETNFLVRLGEYWCEEKCSGECEHLEKLPERHGWCRKTKKPVRREDLYGEEEDCFELYEI